ncbi:DUF1351 domain-containing protein [Anaerostipes sp.]|uniref:DUF1351 domain-containing protein n=1 Tax=Anaerostipes sp. TaxID=1872530 RepID=UPI003967D4DB
MELKIYNPQEEGFLQKIDWNFEELKSEITNKANDYMSLVYTPDQMKEAKKDRAALRKFIAALEDKRKEIKKQVMIPYTDFEEKEKELVSIVNQAVANIDDQIKGYDEAIRQEKLEKVKEIYAKTIGGLADVVTFDKIFKDSWLNVSTSFKSITNEITEIRDKVDNDLVVINADTSPYAYEMKEEYLKNFDLTEAVNKKQQLEETEKKKALFEEQQKQKKDKDQKAMREEIKKIVSAGNEKKESIKERTRAITFRCVVKEHNFKEVNARLNLVTKVCEKFEILEQEEL